MTLAPRSRLGAYQIVDEFGEGGMGVVYRAKIVRGSVAGDHDRRQRFIQEAKAASSSYASSSGRQRPTSVPRVDSFSSDH